MYGYGNSMFLATHGILARSGGGGGIDPDAQAFITAAAITNPTQQSAINQLVVDLKGYSIWSKMKALYPFVGGTATTHKFNLKDPRDLDAAFRLQFFGGITHSSTGITGNGTNGYFDTFLNPSTEFSPTTGGSQFAYIRNNTDTGVDLGAFQSVVNYRFQLQSRGSNNFYGGVLSNAVSTIANTDSRGFFGVTREPNSGVFYSILGTNSYSTTDAYQEPNANITGFALNTNFNNSIFQQVYSNHQFGFAAVANGLTTTESQNLRTAVITFNTALSRNV